MKTQIYYHFLSSKHAIDNLERKRRKVSTLDNLNDPFELMPYRRYEFEKRQQYIKVFKSVSTKWGILCFSQTREEPLLWAHYADNHTGIALGFEIPEGGLIEVKYVSTEIRTKFELTHDPNDNERKLLDLARIKYWGWKYEKEHRLLVPLKDCKQENGLYFISFGNNLKIRNIVLGCRFDHNKKNIEEISELAMQLGVDVIATRPGWGDYLIQECGTRTPQYRKHK